MKKIISILLVLCMISVLLVSCGSRDNSDNTEDNKVILGRYSKGLAFEVSEKNPNECIITGIGSCTDKDIVIPSTINGMRVVGIKEGAFSPKKQEVALGTKIAEVVAENVTDTMIFGGEATNENVSEESNRVSGEASSEVSGGFVGIAPGNVPGNGIVIYDQYQTVGGMLSGTEEEYVTGTGTPIDLEDIESVQIPSTLKEIGEEAFYGCEELVNINTHAGLSNIGKDAFKETAYYNDPQNWEGQALYLSNYLLTVSYEFKGEFTMKEGTTMVADQAFSNCSNITTIYTSLTLTTVGNFAFSGCTSLTDIKFANSATYYTYGTGAFDGCIYYNPYFPTTPEGDTTVDEVVEEEKYLQEYELIDSETFDKIKNNIYVNYTAETQYPSNTNVEILKSSYGYYHYVNKQDELILTELYGDTDANGLVVFMLNDDKLCFSSAKIPMYIEVLQYIDFDSLTVADENRGLYVYNEEGSSEALQLGFKDGKLRYMMLESVDGGRVTYFYDYDRTEVPDKPMDKFVQGVYLDKDGNPQ